MNFHNLQGMRSAAVRLAQSAARSAQPPSVHEFRAQEATKLVPEDTPKVEVPLQEVHLGDLKIAETATESVERSQAMRAFQANAAAAKSTNETEQTTLDLMV